jgi:FKBP-type peptidyl-prolyl cis-trans isomerase FkpA
VSRAPLTALVLLALCGACRHVGFQQRPAEVDRRTIETAGGVTYEELRLGNGVAAGIGDQILLDYTLWLEDGRRVDSTLDRGVPVPVTVGEAFVRGLDDGLVGLRAEGRRRIRVPPGLGYGHEGVPGLVPPDALLVFEVHAIEIRPRAQQ